MKSILLIEDEPDFLESMERLLRTAGYDVVTADNGLQGYRLAEQMLPDLIISDVGMPEFTGIDMLTAIRNKPLTASIPVIFLSSLSDVETLRKSMSLGLDDFLTKTVPGREILVAIKARLERAEHFSSEARARLREQRDMLALIAHDLRGPLTTIYHSLEIMGDAENGNDPSSIKRMESASDMINLLIDRLSAIGRGKTDSLVFKPEAINLGEISERAVNSVFHHRTEKHTISVNCDVTENIYLDPFLTSQILTNLLSNALKYSPNGGMVSLHLSVKGATLLINVTDQGDGISEQELPNIFDRYYRCPGSSHIEGSGLGLSGVKLFAEKQHGTVRCLSRVGQGTTFIVEIPLTSIPQANQTGVNPSKN